MHLGIGCSHRASGQQGAYTGTIEMLSTVLVGETSEQYSPIEKLAVSMPVAATRMMDAGVIRFINWISCMETTRQVFTASAVTLAVLVGSLLIVSTAYATINSSTIRIRVDNSGSLTNTTTGNSNTGGNYAAGSTGGVGGEGGDVSSAGGNDNNGGAEAGAGGSGGNADDGGAVTSGAASSAASTSNTQNDTEVVLTIASGTDVNSSLLAVTPTNSGPLTNTTRARARTGTNTAAGSTGGAGDDGGEVDATGGGSNNNGGATAGAGGGGGTSGLGGTIGTGNASDTSSSTNIRNKVRITLSL